MAEQDAEHLTDYEHIIANIFATKYDERLAEQYEAGTAYIEYTADEARESARALGVALGNAYDIKYSFRNRPRETLPQIMRERSPAGKVWVIEPTTRKGRYAIVLRPVRSMNLTASPHLPMIKIIDATPGIVKKYSTRDVPFARKICRLAP